MSNAAAIAVHWTDKNTTLWLYCSESYQVEQRHCILYTAD